MSQKVGDLTVDELDQLVRRATAGAATEALAATLLRLEAKIDEIDTRLLAVANKTGA